MIIDRPKYQQGGDTQIDQLAEEFQKTECSEETTELERHGGQYSEEMGDVFQGNEKMDRPIPKMYEWDGGEGEERPERKEEKKKIHWKLN